MGAFNALDALTRPEPSIRDFVVRASAHYRSKLTVTNDSYESVRVDIVIATVLLCNIDCITYVTFLSEIGWKRLTEDVVIATNWALENQWSGE